MIHVNFADGQGGSKRVEAAVGVSLMQVALANDIGGIVGDCGGALSCATCHVYVSPEWIDRVGMASPAEEQMLELVMSPKNTSRLSCQIALNGDLDGLIVEIPDD